MTTRPSRAIPQSILPGVFVLAVACGGNSRLREVDVRGSEYSFQAPATLPAGLTAFRFHNEGDVRHELQIFRFRAGVSAHDAALMMAQDSPLKDYRDSSLSVLVAEPGHTTSLRVLVPLAPGEVYGLRCGFQDADTLPKHVRLGMFAVVTVE